MSFGEHLEELRRRLIWSLLGLSIAVIACFGFGDRLIELLTTPYMVAMEQLGYDPRMVQLDPIETFMEYFKITLKFGLVLSAPWIIYQIWKFVEAGLYESERRVVRYFAPSSIVLFLVGASFMLVFVLTGLMKFLIGVSMWFPLPSHDSLLYKFLREAPTASTRAGEQQVNPPVQVPVLSDDPASPHDGQVWINRGEQRLNAYYDGQLYSTRLERMQNQQFVQPFFSVAQYLGFVVDLGLAFGLGFQIPIVVVCLVTIGIFSASQLSAARKYVILGVATLSAILTPSPDVGTMMLLAVPMYLLYEIGLFIGRIVERRRRAEDAASASG